MRARALLPTVAILAPAPQAMATERVGSLRHFPNTSPDIETTVALAIGLVTASASTFTVLGAAGSLLPGRRTALTVVAVLCLLAAVGDGLDSNVDIGPVINETQLRRIDS